MKTADPRLFAAQDMANKAITSAIEEFERETGRMVSSVCLEIIELDRKPWHEPKFTRGGAEIAWNHTQEEVDEFERLKKDWARHFDEDAPRPSKLPHQAFG